MRLTFLALYGPDQGRLAMAAFVQQYRISQAMLEEAVPPEDFAAWLGVLRDEGPAMAWELRNKKFPPLPPGFGPQN